MNKTQISITRTPSEPIEYIYNISIGEDVAKALVGTLAVMSARNHKDNGLSTTLAGHVGRFCDILNDILTPKIY